jgi:trk system potassium uptake protein TrkH
MPRRLSPPALLAGTLLLVIALGAALLRLPLAHEGEPFGWVDAFFTATSAACVTGLAVADTARQLSVFGEAVLLVLIQIGGVGVMTIGTVVVLALGQRLSPALRGLLRGLTVHRPTLRARDVLGTIVLATAGIELAGAALLFLAFARDHAAGRAAWLAVFHSVSAFCNAGFALFPDSLRSFAARPLVNLIFMALIVAGGLGFVVLLELWYWLRQGRRGAYVHLSLHARVVLIASGVATAGGMAGFFLFEWRHALAGRPWGEKVLLAAFQSVTARTAGFDTVDMATLTNPTLLLLLALMFVGAGPGSTAGGIKVTTAAAVLATVVHRLRGRNEVRLLGRAIGVATLQRSVVLAFLAALLVGVSLLGLELCETPGRTDVEARGLLFELAFETVSAFGTVGLSTGVTPKLSDASKVIVMFLMFAGRLGPLLLMDFFQHLPPPAPVRYATEELAVG